MTEKMKNLSSLLPGIFLTSFILVVIARWFHPALFSVTTTYWLAALAVLSLIPQLLHARNND